MDETLVTMVSERFNEKSRYEDAIRDCCIRGGYRFEPCHGVHEGNSELIVRIHATDGQVEHQAVGFRRALTMLADYQPSRLRPRAENLEEYQSAERLVGVG